MYLIGVIVLVIGLVISVALHELGHMIPAKIFGALVPEYFIGFGKRIWSFRRGGTEYGVKWIPLGGYVKILGMYGPAHKNTACYKGNARTYTYEEAMELPEELRNNLEPTLAQDVRTTSLEELPAGQEDRAFYRLPVWKKLVVMAGGITMNLVLSVALVTVALVGIGIETPTTTIASVPQCFGTDKTGAIVPSSNTSNCVPGPAYEAGMKPGDTIIRWDTTPINKWEDLRPAILASIKGTTTAKSIDHAAPSTVVIVRDGEEMSLTIRPLLSSSGQSLAGVTSKMERQSQGIGSVMKVTSSLFTGTLSVVVKLPVEVYQVGKSLFTGQPRDPSGVLSIVGAGRIAGEVASTDGIPRAGGRTYEPSVLDKIGSLIMLLASLNMALFVFNLLPLLPLDGGHVAGALYEAVKRKGAKLMRKDDPGHADTAAMMPLAYAVIAAFIVMTVVLVLADIVNPVSLMG
ncbi:MAG: site-2 protease family protein [Actinomycetaceae bacterium]|nr:site-2 protease family protein [Actinomycetaceae bacterium]